MKSILFLGGGPLGMPAIKWAKEIGFDIIVNDRNQAAPGFELADKKLTFDSTDIRGLTSWALKNNIKYNIQYCYCGSDFGLLTVATIHNVLKIKFPEVKAILNGLDKKLMKESWANSDINYPQSEIIKQGDNIDSIIDNLSSPIVIKPTSSSGSQGVSIIANKNDIKKAYSEAMKYSDEGDVMFEEYIEGSHHDVNGLFWKGKFYKCGVGDRFFTPLPYPVPKYGYYPSVLSIDEKNSLYELVEKGAAAMGISHGPVKGDCVFKDGVAFVYEISPRFHGDIFTANTLEYLYKKNPIYQLFKMVYDKDYQFHNIDFESNVAGWKTIFNSVDEINLNENINLYLRKNNSRSHKIIVKNNNDIVGLAWANASSFSLINEYLNI
jgi:hypothetical protein